MVLRLPRTSLVMVGRGASGCTGCHRHYHSSKVMRTLDTNQRTKSQTCRVLSIYIPRPAEIDSQQLQQTWCEHNFFLTSSYQLQPPPSPKKWIGKANKYEFNWTTLQKQAKDTNDTNQRISQTNKSPRKLALCKAMGWGTRTHWLSPKISLRIQSQNLNASMCNIVSLKWPPLAPFATCQLITKCFDSRNLGTNLGPWMQQRGQSINLP